MFQKKVLFSIFRGQISCLRVELWPWRQSLLLFFQYVCCLNYWTDFLPLYDAFISYLLNRCDHASAPPWSSVSIHRPSPRLQLLNSVYLHFLKWPYLFGSHYQRISIFRWSSLKYECGICLKAPLTNFFGPLEFRLCVVVLLF